MAIAAFCELVGWRNAEMGLPTAEIETAAITRYRADNTLTAQLASATAVFDEGAVPNGQAFNYVTVSTITSQGGTALVFGTDAVDVWLQVAIYTQVRGFAVGRQIAKRIYQLTQQQSFSLADGFTNFFLLFEREQERQQSDGLSQQITHRYKLMTQG
jgi:hypothetical protein